jgi:hypothetical protein
MTTAAPETSAQEAPPARRALRFTSFDEVLAEVERLAAAERDGRLRRAGNWPLGQSLGHLATWAAFALDGYPPEVRAPLPIRLILRVMRNRILTKGMMPGVKVGRVPGGTLGLEPVDTETGLGRLRDVYARLRTTPPTIPNPAFGPLTHDQWIQLNLRHAELHLGHLVPA